MDTLSKSHDYITGYMESKIVCKIPNIENYEKDQSKEYIERLKENTIALNKQNKQFEEYTKDDLKFLLNKRGLDFRTLCYLYLKFTQGPDDMNAGCFENLSEYIHEKLCVVAVPTIIETQCLFDTILRLEYILRQVSIGKIILNRKKNIFYPLDSTPISYFTTNELYAYTSLVYLELPQYINFTNNCVENLIETNDNNATPYLSYYTRDDVWNNFIKDPINEECIIYCPCCQTEPITKNICHPSTETHPKSKYKNNDQCIPICILCYHESKYNTQNYHLQLANEGKTFITYALYCSKDPIYATNEKYLDIVKEREKDPYHCESEFM